MERVPIEHLKNVLNRARVAYPLGTAFRHYKGDLFQVTGFSIDELTNGIRIHYARPEDVENCNGVLSSDTEFSRPINEWQEPVETGRYSGPRFKQV